MSRENQKHDEQSNGNASLAGVTNWLRKVTVTGHKTHIMGYFHRYIDKDGETFALIELDNGEVHKFSVNEYFLIFRNNL